MKLSEGMGPPSKKAKKKVSNFNMYKSDFYTQSVISTHTSVILTLTIVIMTLTRVITTRLSVISTRRV
jgi:hypothetical protein